MLLVKYSYIFRDVNSTANHIGGVIGNGIVVTAPHAIVMDVCFLDAFASVLIAVELNDN